MEALKSRIRSAVKTALHKHKRGASLYYEDEDMHGGKRQSRHSRRSRAGSRRMSVRSRAGSRRHSRKSRHSRAGSRRYHSRKHTKRAGSRRMSRYSRHSRKGGELYYDMMGAGRKHHSRHSRKSRGGKRAVPKEFAQYRKVVDEVRRRNPHLNYKAVLKKAATEYHKHKGGSRHSRRRSRRY